MDDEHIEKHGLDKYLDEDGQPTPYVGAEARIVVDVRLCEPLRPLGGAVASSCSSAECSRVAFRSIGDDPWVHCSCGNVFNANYTQFGALPWPAPVGGVLKVPYE